jgi:hypothetical protein
MLTLSHVVALTLSAAGASSMPADCAFDREALLQLDYRSFDQDIKGGWRALAGKGCNREAADLIRDWRLQHKDSRYILFWHEGQSRAFDGDYEAAVDLFEQSRRSAEDRIGWNFYVDGSVAFLRGDMAKLQAARANLAQMPKPLDWDTMKGANGKLLKVAWPVNLNVLDGFIRCWGKRYRDAYGCPGPAP